MNEENKSFEYTYSAKEQAEIKRIREKYTTEREEAENKLECLYRLDESVTQKSTVAALITGIISALILGGGMSAVLVFNKLLLGIIIGAIGIIGVVLAYPVYTYITKKEHEKIAPEIIRLTDELMK